MRNGTNLALHIIPDRKLHTISFQMTYNVTMCTVGTLNSSSNAFLEFGRSTDWFIWPHLLAQKIDQSFP